MRVKLKMIQKARKINLASTNSRDNILIPCKIKPRKAEYKIIRPAGSNL